MHVKDIEKNQIHFLITMLEAAELRYEKFLQYGDSYRNNGLRGLIVRLSDKIARLTNFYEMIDNHQLADDYKPEETFRDTLIDAANYAIMGVMIIDDNTVKASTTGLPTGKPRVFKELIKESLSDMGYGDERGE